MAGRSVSMSAAAKAAFEWPAELAHAPQSPEATLGGQFKASCRCGYEGKAVSTPSHAYNATKVHAETENRRASGKLEVPALVGGTRQRPVASSRGGTGSPGASRGGAGTPCGCGCGEPSGGLFRPGHDSKLLSRLLGEIRSGAKTLADAHAEMDTIGTSDKLKAKLAQKAVA